MTRIVLYGKLQYDTSIALIILWVSISVQYILIFKILYHTDLVLYILVIELEIGMVLFLIKFFIKKIQVQFWSRSLNTSQDQHTLAQLHSQGLLILSPNNTSDQLWECFKNAFDMNKRGQDGRIRILSIVANEYTYAELEEKLGVGINIYLKIKI